MKPPDELLRLHEVFAEADADGSGSLDAAELAGVNLSHHSLSAATAHVSGVQSMSERGVRGEPATGCN